jgi:microcystin-dependent protein
MSLQFIITDAGRAAIAQVGGAIGPVTLTKIALGSAGYTPLANRTALQTEIKRLDPSGSSVPVPGTISITAQDNSADSYSVREIGLYTNNNVLFAICAQSAVIMTKASGSVALFAMDFVMTNVPAGTVTVGNVGFTYSQATETAMGVLGIATTAEAQAGTIDTKIITPLKLAQVTATETRRGVIALASTTEAQALVPDATKALTVARLVDRAATTGRAGVVLLASKAETQTGTDTAKAVTPAGLAARTATDTRAGIVELATNAETQTGTDATRAVTPAGLKSSLAGYAAATHGHGNITNAGAIGAAANLPIITGANGVLQAGSFGATANTFCQGNDSRLSQATSSAAGIVELADNTETQTGTSSTLAVTPASLASRTATDARAGIVELATNAETQNGTDTTRAVTPASLASAAALFVPPGAVLPFAMNVVPSGWLAANGSAVSRTLYPALFAAIGTLYGVGDGSTTFALPDLRGYFVRGSGTNSDGTASGTFGEKQEDAFQAHEHTFRYPKKVTDGSNGADHTVTDSATYTSETTTAIQSKTGFGIARSASETRPKNIALLYCIKF